MPKLCPNCFTNQAQEHLTLGVLPCSPCKTRLDNFPTPQQAAEIIPDYIKEERKERQDSIEQPHFKGELNKKWVDLWGKKAAKERGFSEKEIKNAKYVNDKVRNNNQSIRYYKDST
jgi:hypothetical protein